MPGCGEPTPQRLFSQTVHRNRLEHGFVCRLRQQAQERDGIAGDHAAHGRKKFAVLGICCHIDPVCCLIDFIVPLSI